MTIRVRLREKRISSRFQTTLTALTSSANLPPASLTAAGWATPVAVTFFSSRPG